MPGKHYKRDLRNSLSGLKPRTLRAIRKAAVSEPYICVANWRGRTDTSRAIGCLLTAAYMTTAAFKRELKENQGNHDHALDSFLYNPFTGFAEEFKEDEDLLATVVSNFDAWGEQSGKNELVEFTVAGRNWTHNECVLKPKAQRQLLAMIDDILAERASA